MTGDANLYYEDCCHSFSTSDIFNAMRIDAGHITQSLGSSTSSSDCPPPSLSLRSLSLSPRSLSPVSTLIGPVDAIDAALSEAIQSWLFTTMRSIQACVSAAS